MDAQLQSYYTDNFAAIMCPGEEVFVFKTSLA